MRFFGMTSAIIGALAIALMSSGAVPPAAAGPACAELDLGSPCIRSNDIRANLALGGPTGNARLQLRDAAGAQGVDLRANNGNVTNQFSNVADRSNGLVKAWARINPDGTIAACWRCNTDSAETRQITALGVGNYEVDFTPLATDIRGRPRSVTIDDVSSFAAMLANAERLGDPSSVFVNTRTGANAPANIGFVVVIY